jgi:hypothetical protein
MNAREIADGLKKAKFRSFLEVNEALAPLRDHAKRLYAAGGPTVLHEAIQAAVIDLARSIGRLRDRIENDARDAKEALAALESGNAPTSYTLTEQTNHSAIVVAEVVETQRGALLVLLDVFATLGDRIDATPEEQEARTKENAARKAREQEALVAQWSKKSAAALMEAARVNGLPVVGKKADMVAALAEKGIQPNAA